jgi:hypothetical protein
LQKQDDGARNRGEKSPSQRGDARSWQACGTREEPEHEKRAVGTRQGDEREHDAGRPRPRPGRCPRRALEKAQREGDEPRDESLLEAIDRRDGDRCRRNQQRASHEQARCGYAAASRLESHTEERHEHAGEPERAGARNVTHDFSDDAVQHHPE